jgi:hypothetical protein
MINSTFWEKNIVGSTFLGKNMTSSTIWEKHDWQHILEKT